MYTGGEIKYGLDNRHHEAMAVQHWPQMNAATIKTGLSEKQAIREVDRLNLLNDPIMRHRRLVDLYEYEEAPA